MSGFKSLKDSHRSLRALLRITDFLLNFFPHTTPHRSLPSGDPDTESTQSPETYLVPCSLTCSNSDFRRSLSVLFKLYFNEQTAPERILNVPVPMLN